MKTKCLYCYQELDWDSEFHENCAKQFFGTKQAPTLPYSLLEMSELAKEVIDRSVSVPGVQAKLSMSLVKKHIQEQQRLTVVGALGGNYILKPANEQYPYMPENEHLTMRLAELYGIPVVPSSLIRLQSGELSYITKRIDRNEKGEKLHMLDMFQILEAFDKYKGSMEKVGKAIVSYSENTLLDARTFFELTLFCYFTGNSDMHLKNFSLLKTPHGWSFSPAYDLLNVAIVLPEDTEELALTIGGKKKKITKELFVNFAFGLGLNQKQIESVFVHFFSKKDLVFQLIQQSFLPIEFQEKYIEFFENRMAKIK
jgi:serine/threonine-protein kinase HipA